MDLRITARGNRFASLGQSITVDVDRQAGMITLGAPFYRRSIPLQDVASVSSHTDDGLNRGLLNWYVTGKATSPQGVRLNTGGKARVDLETKAGERYAVVVDTLDQAVAVVDAVRGQGGDS
ncbi:hypothetical protein [Luteococcus japonicus]|uniref:Uncharacterized protein n=1 Tax=Luteococcus japonicus TaxID=33984 RepID=A0A3N1ZWM4_9ACTN|nr:hypothetical protein [Luteococcus japonicus]ROR55128.1 hypothetical protein EDD41_2382 [Luteococcus japonicus]